MDLTNEVLFICSMFKRSENCRPKDCRFKTYTQIQFVDEHIETNPYQFISTKKTL